MVDVEGTRISFGPHHARREDSQTTPRLYLARRVVILIEQFPVEFDTARSRGRSLEFNRIAPAGFITTPSRSGVLAR